MRKIETVLSPALFHLYEDGIENKIVVVIDILRATTTMCVAFNNGVESIVACATPEEASQFREQGFLAAAERHGETVPGFELGNSPKEYTREKIAGRKIAFTTTNGTRALQMSSAAKKILVGSFLNISALAKVISTLDSDVILFCAGWKDKFNLEDTLFAGALADKVSENFEISGDASQAAVDLYNLASGNLPQYLQKASHFQRFKSLHTESDLDICLQMDITKKIPCFSNGLINLLQYESAH
jgi:2-phosphosulfolactate phosphatase